MIEPEEITMFVTTDGHKFMDLTNAKIHEAEIFFKKLVKNEFELDTETEVNNVANKIYAIIKKNPETIRTMLCDD